MASTVGVGRDDGRSDLVGGVVEEEGLFVSGVVLDGERMRWRRVVPMGVARRRARRMRAVVAKPRWRREGMQGAG